MTAYAGDVPGETLRCAAEACLPRHGVYGGEGDDDYGDDALGDPHPPNKAIAAKVGGVGHSY